MSQRIVPPINTFLSRLVTVGDLSGRNVILMIHGDFARSLPGSDHAAGTTSTVFATYAQTGTTGRVTGNVGYPPAVGRMREVWSGIAGLAKLPTNPFGGANPHAALVR